ncbi:MAG: hypothetical protein FWE57_12240, partial [Chitinispirillia bacterium]|nr:hypothetical protein [Chitinispirillia bacterium]
MDINTQMRLTGLATGLDTDEVIRNMGRVHNLRIDAVNRERQLAVWRQEMYRETISMLSGFQRSHLNLSNPSNNFRSPSAFAKFSFNLSLGGSAEAAARIMSVSANGDLRNFNQSVQAVAQLATKDTFNGSERGLQGINSSGFDFENFLTRTPKISDPAERAAKLDSFVNNALRDGLDFDGWGKDRATFISFMDGLDNDWHLDKFASAFETFFKDDGNFEDWLVSNPGGDWNGFLADPANAAIIDEALDEFKTDRAAAIKDLAWSQYQTDNSAAINDDWNDFLESPAYATAVSDIRAAATAKFNSDNADNVTFRYVMFGVSIDGVSRTVTLTNTELEEIYKEGDTPQQKAQAFADLVNSKLGNLFGKDFNNMVSVHSGELRVHKAGSSITLFAETGFESSLRNMGFTTGANNRNFGNKTVGELFPSMFGQAMRGTGASATPTYQFDNNGHPLFKGADGYVVDGSNRQVFVDGNDNLLFRSSDGNFIDRNNRQVFVDNNDNLIFRNSNGTFVDADNRTVTGSGFEPLRTAINSNPDLAARLDNGKVKPLVNDNTVIHINNTAITISSSDSVAEMMAKVNSSSAGVDLTYDAAGDRFVLTSRQEGSANSIDMVPLSSSTTLNATGNFLTAIGILQEKDGGGFEYAERQEAKNLRA